MPQKSTGFSSFSLFYFSFWDTLYVSRLFLLWRNPYLPHNAYYAEIRTCTDRLVCAHKKAPPGRSLPEFLADKVCVSEIMSIYTGKDQSSGRTHRREIKKKRRDGGDCLLCLQLFCCLWNRNDLSGIRRRDPAGTRADKEGWFRKDAGWKEGWSRRVAGWKRRVIPPGYRLIKHENKTLRGEGCVSDFQFIKSFWRFMWHGMLYNVFIIRKVGLWLNFGTEMTVRQDSIRQFPFAISKNRSWNSQIAAGWEA